MYQACLIVVLLLTGCQANELSPPLMVAHLGADDGDPGGLEAIRVTFAERNPGYDIELVRATTGLDATDTDRIVFVQAGQVGDGIRRGLAVGDILALRAGRTMHWLEPLDVVVFTVPEPWSDGLPSMIRPDWDEKITDTPGGCATETGAYRRILLTWLPERGPYIYHGLNAHRVRITDSFTHYHPVDGGFDEFYLVQMVQPGARLVTSRSTSSIERPESVTNADARTLLDTLELEVGDLVYLPRGLAHRGLGGVLAQVIAVPGFRPDAEIGLDHQLRAINERLGLAGATSLPYHEAASLQPVVK